MAIVRKNFGKYIFVKITYTNIIDGKTIEAI